MRWDDPSMPRHAVLSLLPLVFFQATALAQPASGPMSEVTSTAPAVVTGAMLWLVGHSQEVGVTLLAPFACVGADGAWVDADTCLSVLPDPLVAMAPDGSTTTAVGTVLDSDQGRSGRRPIGDDRRGTYWYSNDPARPTLPVAVCPDVTVTPDMLNEFWSDAAETVLEVEGCYDLNGDGVVEMILTIGGETERYYDMVEWREGAIVELGIGMGFGD